MSLVGKVIILSGLTQKGKNRIRDHGNRWTVIAETDHVLFSPEKKGHWLFITPIGKGHDDTASRWIRVNDDVDFSVSLDGG